MLMCICILYTLLYINHEKYIYIYLYMYEGGALKIAKLFYNSNNYGFYAIYHIYSSCFSPIFN